LHKHRRLIQFTAKQTIAGVATALLQVAQPTFRTYAKQVIANARTLASRLVEHGYKLQTGGTDNHLVLWDLRPLGLTGSKVEKVCDLMGITINSKKVPPPGLPSH
jgi:glycine hydroxymethyltransferase